MPRSRTTWTKEKPPANAFKPGQSGNPKGRPPTSLLEPARAETAPTLERLRWLRDHAKDERVQLDACAELLNRGWGKPYQGITINAHLTTEIGGVDRPPLIDESDAEWLERRRAELQALEFERKPQHTQHANTAPPPIDDDAASEPRH